MRSSAISASKIAVRTRARKAAEVRYVIIWGIGPAERVAGFMVICAAAVSSGAVSFAKSVMTVRSAFFL